MALLVVSLVSGKPSGIVSPFAAYSAYSTPFVATSPYTAASYAAAPYAAAAATTGAYSTGYIAPYYGSPYVAPPYVGASPYAATYASFPHTSILLRR